MFAHPVDVESFQGLTKADGKNCDVLHPVDFFYDALAEGGVGDLLAFLIAADTRQNASIAVKGSKKKEFMKEKDIQKYMPQPEPEPEVLPQPEPEVVEVTSWDDLY